MALPEPPGRVPEPQLARIERAWGFSRMQRLLVIDKPTGMAVHGGSGLSYGLIESLRVLFGRPDASWSWSTASIAIPLGCLVISNVVAPVVTAPTDPEGR